METELDYQWTFKKLFATQPKRNAGFSAKYKGLVYLLSRQIFWFGFRTKKIKTK